MNDKTKENLDYFKKTIKRIRKNTLEMQLKRTIGTHKLSKKIKQLLDEY